MHHKADHPARTFGFLAIAAGLLGAVACSSAPEPVEEDPAVPEAAPELPSKKKSATPAPPPAPTPPADPTPTPAPTPTPEPDAGAPPPTGGACEQLGPCCSKITDQLANFACNLIKHSGQEPVCQVRLALCSILP